LSITEDGGAEISEADGVNFGKKGVGAKGCSGPGRWWGTGAWGDRAGLGSDDGAGLGSEDGAELGSGNGVKLGAGPGLGGSDMCWSKLRPKFLVGALDLEKSGPI